MGTDAAVPHERLTRIEAVTDAALGHLGVEELLTELLDRVRELLPVDTAAVLLVDASGEYLVAAAERGIEGEVRQGVQVPVGSGFAGRIAALREPVAVEQADRSNDLARSTARRASVHCSVFRCWRTAR